MTKPNPNARPLAAPIGVPRLIRKFWMSPELQAAAAEYAYQQRSTISQLIRDQLQAIKENPTDETRMSKYDSTSSTNSVSAAVDDQLYFGAKDAAYPTRRSVTSLVRRRLLYILESEGMWKQEAA